MKCSEIEAMIDRYLDRELSEKEILIVEKHLGVCAECREKYDSLIGLLSNCPDIEVPTGLCERILARAASLPVEKSSHRPYRFLAAAASIVLIVGTWWMMPSRQPASVSSVATSEHQSPWLASSLLQNTLLPGINNPMIVIAQTLVMEDLTKQMYREPELVFPQRSYCEIQESPEPAAIFPMLEFTTLSSFYRL